MRLHGVSQEISGIYYIRRNLLKTTLRKESEAILLLASKTDVHIYIYIESGTADKHVDLLGTTLLNLACIKSKNVT